MVGTRALTGVAGVGYDAWMNGSNFLSSILPLVLFLVSCGSAGGQSTGYTLRFETLTETVPSGNDQVPARVMPFGDGWVAFN